MAVQDIEKPMLNRIRGNGKGWCLTPRDFADIGSAAAVWTALHRLNQRGAIRRLSAAEKQPLLKDRLNAPGWMRRLLAEIGGVGGA